jgi:N-acetylglucosaminyl-diphospho-decaprenol L-rhamnosyltransferase
VIVNYRTAGLVVDCLRSLAPEVAGLPGTRVIVVDNASGDGSAERIAGAAAAEGWSGWVATVPLPDNEGFSAGNDAAIQRLRAASEPPEWFLLLNPDTVVRPGALRALLERGAADPRTGIVGSRLEDPDGTPQISTFRFHTALSQLDEAASLGPLSRLLRRHALAIPVPAEACQVPWVSGASLMVRREVIDEIGSLDSGYFLYFEEVDLCLRATRAGWKCLYEPRSRVVHLVGRATGVDPSVAIRRLPSYVLESRRRYFVKNHGLPYAMLADLAWLAGHLSWRLRMRLQGRPERAAPGVLGDFLRHAALTRGRGSPTRRPAR